MPIKELTMVMLVSIRPLYMLPTSAPHHQRRSWQSIIDLTWPLGSIIGERVMQMQIAHGVRLHNGIGVSRLVGDRALGAEGHVTAVELQGGAVLPADVVLVAIGAAPQVSWLEGSGLTLQNGILCNEFCQAAPDIYAAGDVANWYHPYLKRQVRLEHRMHATEQAQAMGVSIGLEALP